MRGQCVAQAWAYVRRACILHGLRVIVAWEMHDTRVQGVVEIGSTAITPRTQADYRRAVSLHGRDFEGIAVAWFTKDARPLTPPLKRAARGSKSERMGGGTLWGNQNPD